MQWRTTEDPAVFAAHVLPFLAQSPVGNTILLTEINFLLRHRAPGSAQLYGWAETDPGEVVGAFLRGPGHPTLLTEMPTDAFSALSHDLAAGSLGVPASLAADACARWDLAVRQRFTIWRAERVRESSGHGVRAATEADLALLHQWFDDFRASHPEDPSDRHFVIDDPLADHGILLAVEDGTPRAMASRSPVIAGMTRLGLAWPPDRTDLVDRAVDALLAESGGRVSHVVVLTPHQGPDATRWRDRGFAPVAQRALLAP